MEFGDRRCAQEFPDRIVLALIRAANRLGKAIVRLAVSFEEPGWPRSQAHLQWA